VTKIMLPEFNRDYPERDRMLFGHVIEWVEENGGVEHFRDLSVATLKELIARNFADPDERQNDSPSIGQFLQFLEKYPHVKAHGYAVSPNREDYRVSLEGVEYDGPVSAELYRDFRALSSSADDFVCTHERLYCWYD
jgi:hypothetical protein